MAIQDDFKSQYRAGLRMLRQTIERCPEELWGAVIDEHPRTFWRIAYHTVFYTHFYLSVDCDSFLPWEKHVWHGRLLWIDEREGSPPEETPLTKTELIEYVDWVGELVDSLVDAINFESPESGFPWYPVSKREHQLVNLRHLGVHTGQLQTVLYGRNVELDWFGRG